MQKGNISCASGSSRMVSEVMYHSNKLDTLCIELTTKCPLRCMHCSANALPERQDTFDLSILTAHLPELSNLKEIYLSGGEPFEYSQLLDALRLTSRIAQRVIVYSSGVVSGPVSLQTIAKATLLNAQTAGMSRIDLSLYATSSALHEEITLLPGSYEYTLACAQNLRELGIPFGIHFVPIGSASSEVLKVAHLASELGATRFHVLALAPQGRGRFLKDVAIRADFRQLIMELLSTSFEMEVLISSNLRKVLELDIYTQRDSWQSLFIDVNGYVYPGEGKRIASGRSRVALGTGHPLGEIVADLV